MCGRYVLQDAGQIPLRFSATADDAVRAALADRFNIAPTEAWGYLACTDGDTRPSASAPGGNTSTGPMWRGRVAIRSRQPDPRSPSPTHDHSRHPRVALSRTPPPPGQHPARSPACPAAPATPRAPCCG